MIITISEEEAEVIRAVKADEVVKEEVEEDVDIKEDHVIKDISPEEETITIKTRIKIIKT